MTGHALADRRLHPGTMGLRLLKGLPQTVLVFPAILTAASDIGWRYFLPIAAASIILSALARWIAWRCFRYGIGPGELVIEQGVIQRSRRTIPFDRIQDVDFEQGPLHRILGLVRLRFETGGQGADEGVLDSVAVAEAERLRAAVRGRPAEAAPGGAGIGGDADAPVFSMSFGRVLLSGLFDFSLLWIAGIFALLQTFSNWLPFDIRDIGSWIGLAERNLAGRVTPGAVATMLLLAVALGLAGGVATALTRDFGFRLTSEPAGFRCRRGLLTRRDMLILRARIQLGLILSGPVGRAAGYQELAFQTLGTGDGARGGGLQDAAPFADDREIAAILSATAALRPPGDTPLARVSRRHVWKAAVPVAAFGAAAVAIAAMAQPALILFGLAIPPVIAIAIVERGAHRYALDRDLLFVQAGYWRRRLWIVPLASVQAMTLRRTWLQRRLGVATLILDTAGAASGAGAAIRDLRIDPAEALLSAVTERNRNGWV